MNMCWRNRSLSTAGARVSCVEYSDGTPSFSFSRSWNAISRFQWWRLKKRHENRGYYHECETAAHAARPASHQISLCRHRAFLYHSVGNESYLNISRQTFISSIPVSSWNWRTFSVSSLLSSTSFIIRNLEYFSSFLCHEIFLNFFEIFWFCFRFKLWLSNESSFVARWLDAFDGYL